MKRAGQEAVTLGELRRAALSLRARNDRLDLALTFLRDVARRLDGGQLDSLHFTGPGTDLTVGLLDGARWEGGGMTSAEGIRYLPNIPTEEVFTTPDPERTHGVVASTKPLLVSGRTISGLWMRFEGGRAVQIDADEGAELMRELVARDEHANRLGEVALVDSSGRIGRSGLVFHDTLFDENAASHVALGAAYKFTLRGGEAMDDEEFERAGGNRSATHVDFMIGSEELDVDGVRADGSVEPVMRRGDWV